MGWGATAVRGGAGSGWTAIQVGVKGGRPANWLARQPKWGRPARARRGGSISEQELESEAQAAGGEGQDLLDDYYQLDFEDLIGDTPTRFKYGRGEAIDFGLTAEEMLLLDDKDLKQIIPMSVVTAPHKYLAPAKLKAIRKKARKLLEEMGLRPREGEEEGEQKRRRHEEGGGGWEEEDEEGKRKRKRSKGKELGGEREEAEEDRKKHKHTHKHKHDGDWGNRRQKRERGGKGEREERRRSKRTDEMEREDAGGGVGVDSDRLASYGIKPVKPTQHASRHNSKRAGSGHTSRNQRTHAVAPAAPESSPSAATRHPQRGAHHVEQASDEHRTTRDPPRSAGNKGKEGTVEREGKQGAKADNEGKAALPHEARRSKIEVPSPCLLVLDLLALFSLLLLPSSSSCLDLAWMHPREKGQGASDKPHARPIARTDCCLGHAAHGRNACCAATAGIQAASRQARRQAQGGETAQG